MKTQVTSNISKLINYKNLPEAFQHVRNCRAGNLQEYYHVSGEGQGYDACSFNKNNFHRIVTEEDFRFIKFHEYKTFKGPSYDSQQILLVFLKIVRFYLVLKELARPVQRCVSVGEG